MSTFSTLLHSANRYRRLVSSQYWSDEELGASTQAALDETLQAAAMIPFYAARWNGSLRAGDLSRLPTIGRREIGALNRSALSLYPNGIRHSSHSSSGSTGTPAEFLFDASHQSGRLASRIRYLRAHGWTPLKRTAWLIYEVIRTERNEDQRLMTSRLRIANHIISATAGLFRHGRYQARCENAAT